MRETRFGAIGDDDVPERATLGPAIAGVGATVRSGSDEQAAVDFLQSFFGSAYREDFAIQLWTGVTLAAFRSARFTRGALYNRDAIGAT